MLLDYFPNECKEILAKLDKFEDEEPMIETCRVIIIYKEEGQEDNDEDELELNQIDEDDSLSKQLYDRYGRTYISKK